MTIIAIHTHLKKKDIDKEDLFQCELHLYFLWILFIYPWELINKNNFSMIQIENNNSRANSSDAR